jgi:hypothetical protein
MASDLNTAGLTTDERILLEWALHSNRERTFKGKVSPAVRWARQTLRKAGHPARAKRLVLKNGRALAVGERERCAADILCLARQISQAIRAGAAESVAVDSLELATRIEEARARFGLQDRRARAASVARTRAKQARDRDIETAIRRYLRSNPDGRRNVASAIARSRHVTPKVVRERLRALGL